MTTQVSSRPTTYGLTRLSRYLATCGGPSAAARKAAEQLGEASAEARLLARAVADTDAISNPQDIGLRELGRSFADAMIRRTVISALRAAVPEMRDMLPFKPLLRVDDAAGADWVREGGITPVTSQDFGLRLLEPLKIAAIVACSTEFARAIGSNADRILERALVRALSRVENERFVATTAGVAGERPDGVFMGAQSIAAAGDPKAALAALVAGFAGDLKTSALMMNPATAFALAMALDDTDIGAAGGLFFGLPLVTNDDVPQGFVGLIDVGELEVVDAGLVPGFSDQALLTVDDGGGAGPVPMNLWESNAVALRVVKFTNWSLPDASYARYCPNIFA